MKAKTLVRRMGKKLVGCLVGTDEMGDYPGGVAKVISLGDDPSAPEIVFNVHLAGWGNIGVLDFEQVIFHGQRERTKASKKGGES